MLSNSIIRSASQAKHYFLGADNYYTKNDDMAKERSEWWGNGAKVLGLSGQVDEKIFESLLKGIMPTGEQLGLKLNNEIKHRPGFDLTFSVPKSVSIVALLGEDPRVMEAIQKAADSALSLVERSCAQARITKEGKTVYENTKNLVAAKFLHDLSREGDPQLHVHSVILNMTQRSDGKWRSLASQMGNYSKTSERDVNGFIERVRNQEHYFGLAFSADLAFNLKRLGYNISNNHEKGTFEITGISEQTIKTYSRRSQQIEKTMEELGFSGARAAALVTLKTRQSKKNIDRDNLNELWKNLSDSKGIDAFSEAKICVSKALEKEVSQKNQGGKGNSDIILSTAHSREAVQYAIDVLSENNISIKEMDILNLALRDVYNKNMNDLSIASILKTIEEFQLNGDLIPVNAKDSINQLNTSQLFTTKKQLQYERSILEAIQLKSKNDMPLMQIEKIKAYVGAIEISSEQKKAIETLFSNTQKIGLLDGSTGAGKTHLVKPMRELAKLDGYHTLFLSPSKSQAEAFKEDPKNTPKTFFSWIASMFEKEHQATVSGFIAAPDKYIDATSLIKRKAIAFIDNAHLLSAKQWHDLSQISRKTNLRIIGLGDKNSPQTFLAGSPYTQMIDHGAVTAALTKNYRTQDKDLQEAVSYSLEKNINAAFEKIQNRIFEIEPKEDRLQVMAAHYVHLPEQERNKTLLLMPSNAQCEEMNFAVREVLKQNGQLSEKIVFTEALIPKYLKEAEYKYVKFYQTNEKNSWIRFNTDNLLLDIRKGDYLKILSVNEKENVMVLENQKGKAINWSPSKLSKSGSIELFTSKVREIAVSELLIWRRNDKASGLINGEHLRIADINGDKVVLVTEKNKTKIISLKNKDYSTKHFDYGYAGTAYQKNSASASNVIAYQSSQSRQSHQRMFYKIIGQASENAWIYTENKDSFLKNLNKHTGDKVTAIDLMLGAERHPSNFLNVSDSSHSHISLIEKAIRDTLENTKLLVQEKFKEKTPQDIAKLAVSYAVNHLSEREAAFEHSQIMDTALHHILGKADSTLIQEAIIEAEKRGDIVRGLYSINGTRWTTKQAISTEKEILALAENISAQNHVKPIASIEKVEEHIKNIQPKEEHAKTIRAMMNENSPIINIQGYAGVGKTTLLKHIEPLLLANTILKQEKCELLCLAPTHQAVKELKARGLNAQTLESFLVQNRSKDTEVLANKTTYNYQKIIALDEASMMSNRQARDFLKIAQMQETRAWIIGDIKQNPAIESGKPFSLLQKSGKIKTFYLTDIERQKNKTLLKAVKETYSGNFKEVFKTLEKNIVEIPPEKIGDIKIPSRESILKAIGEYYVGLSKAERAKTLVMSLGNDERIDANNIIRKKLIETGELTGNSMNSDILVSRDMTAAQKSFVENYQIGDKLLFNMPDPINKIEKHEYLTVKEIQKENNILILTKIKEKNKQEIAFQPRPDRPLEVYRSDTRSLMSGDLIRWTRTDKELDFFSAETLMVEKVGANAIELKLVKAGENGWVEQDKKYTMNPNDTRHQHWEHAYCITSYSAQSTTRHRVIFHAQSGREHLTNQPNFLVGLTRAVNEITIFTDDKKKLLEMIESNAKEKASALEVIGEVSTSKNDLQNRIGMNENISPNLSKNNSPKASQQKSSQLVVVTSNNKKMPLDSQKIFGMLNDNAESVVERLLGEPKEKTAKVYRYGNNKGSMVVTLKGEKRGLWHDFQTGESGNLLTLVAQNAGLSLKNKKDFRPILEEAIRVLGTSESAVSKYDFKNNSEQQQKKINELSLHEQKTVKYAQKLARESQPIKGTLAEKYLKEHRGINLQKYPDSIRFHPAIYSKDNQGINPALLVVGKDEDGKVKAVQAIFLDEKTANKADVKIKKQTWGLPSKGGMVNIATKQGPDRPLLLTEGPETGLSIFQAMPDAHVKVTLSKANFNKLSVNVPNKNIVLCLDNDGQNILQDKLIQKAATTLLEQGKNVWVALPESLENQSKTDYNDILKTNGEAAIQNNIKNAVLYSDFIQGAKSNLSLEKAVLNNLNTEKLNEFIEKTNGAIVSENKIQEIKKEHLEYAIEKIGSQNNTKKLQKISESLYGTNKGFGINKTNEHPKNHEKEVEL